MNQLSLDEKKPEGKKITVGSLFSGIGGIELGLEMTGGFRTIWFCENDAYASAVLKKNWKGVPNLGDITKVDWNAVEKPDMLTGGFPCQDISTAGKQEGISEDTRSGLWFEYAKAISSLRPRLALIENVPALAYNGLDIVLSSLARMRYDAEWFSLSAAGTGAPHRRKRIFIIAYSNGERLQERRGGKPVQEARARLECDCQAVPHPDSTASSRQQSFGWTRIAKAKAERLAASSGEGWWATEPDVGRVADGISFRVDKLRCLGNAVVPQVAQVIGEMILEVEA
jgi:DNA (cytosine-5)-methyltransferase 1